MKQLLFLVFISIGHFAHAQDITGDWHGVLKLMGTELRLVFHVSEENGAYSATMDSPDQGATDIPTDKTTVNGNQIKIEAAALGLVYEGVYEAEANLIKGTFKQGPVEEPLELGRAAIEKKEIIRHQEPKSFDYKQEDVKIKNNKGGHILAGTLTIPNTHFNQVAILISGSGPQDRNEELLGHKPFLVLSDYLTKNGIAVFRYDDRGTAESTGDFATATSADFADDAEAILGFLKERDDMQGKKIGFVGHSEGGMIAPMVASRTDVDFIVLLAGPGIAIDTLMIEQQIAIMKSEGKDDDFIQANVASSGRIFSYMKENNNKDDQAFERDLRSLVEEAINQMSEEEKSEIPGGDIPKYIDQQIDQLTAPWFKYFMAFDPSDYLTKVTCPVLAVNGEMDTQVLPKSNLAGIEASLKAGGNQSYVIKELPKLNHLFQVTETGAPSEYGVLEETFNVDAMKIVMEWIYQLQ